MKEGLKDLKILLHQFQITEMHGSFPSFLLKTFKNSPKCSKLHKFLSKLYHREERKQALVFVMMEITVNGSPKLKRVGAAAPHWLVSLVVTLQACTDELGPI